jgi:hypothetical protein
MRVFWALAVLVCAGAVWAQTPGAKPEDSEVARARLEVERLKGLVEMGAIPRAQLTKAEEAVGEARDSALLRSNIQQQDLTEEKADELVAAAGRQFDRRKNAFDEAKRLVETGIAPEISLSAALQDLDFARRQCELVETRARLAREMAQMAEAEAALEERMARAPAEARAIAERFDGDGIFTPQIFRQVEAAYESRFGKTLPVSANGETAVHRALGFDHRGRVDVALRPDQPEGVWLREYLVARRIPFFAFRQAVPGKATGAHIHLGPISGHIQAGG